mmetsp:Transcript_15681/g.24046  ORF Transcript_15681/g.24046 Transcript_15681/m.24046 type:complete len:163 (-) Transcript_15681:1535-2023(-)
MGIETTAPPSMPSFTLDEGKKEEKPIVPSENWMTPMATQVATSAPAPTRDKQQADDGFGDFGGDFKEEEAKPSCDDWMTTTAGPATKTETKEDDGFGDFGGFEEASKPEPEDDGFGDFDGPSPTKVDPAAAPKQDDDGFGDFGGFDEQEDNDPVIEEVDYTG